MGEELLVAASVSFKGVPVSKVITAVTSGHVETRADVFLRHNDYGLEWGVRSWSPCLLYTSIVTKEEKYRAMFLEMNLLDEKQWENYQEDSGTAAIFACILKDGIFRRRELYIWAKSCWKGRTCWSFGFVMQKDVYKRQDQYTDQNIIFLSYRIVGVRNIGIY